MTPRLFRIPPRYAGLTGLCLLALLDLALCRYDLYGIDEGAARGLLLDWSIASQVLNPVAILGFPDMRALLFAPLDIHWIGDLTAAKVLTMYLTLAAALMLYRWAEKNLGDETALLATGLWLLAPLTISQIDSIGTGNYLILSAVICHWLESRFRATSQTISTWYFLLLLITAFAASMHPAGLGLAAGLGWHWLRDDGGFPRKRLALLSGMGLMIAFVLLSRMGWPELALFINPYPALSGIIAGDAMDTPSIGLAMIALALLVLSTVAAMRRAEANLFGVMLTSGLIFGAAAADHAWAQLALVMILFEGGYALIRLNSRFRGNGLLARRGITAVVVVALCTIFMLMDKQRFLFIHNNGLHPTDEVIANLADLSGGRQASFLVASQWPGRTMLATRRGALPLPPVKNDPEAFLRQMRGVAYMAFDHNDSHNRALNRQVAQLSDRIKTVSILPGGVILKLPPERPGNQ